MADSNMQLQWTDEQWNKVRQVVYEEARKARVAGNVLPLCGPLEPDARYASGQVLSQPPASLGFAVDDTDSLKLVTLREVVYLRGAQVADPELSSALIAFRRAANRIARREDEVILLGHGQEQDDEGRAAAPVPAESAKSAKSDESDESGLVGAAISNGKKVSVGKEKPKLTGTANAKDRDAENGAMGRDLVHAISRAIGKLEKDSHFGPFACLLGPRYFLAVQTPSDSMVSPQDRILPFLQGGALLRTSVLKRKRGLVIALGGEPIDLVVATDISVRFLQVTAEAQFVFRVYEKIVLRIKDAGAIAVLKRPKAPAEKTLAKKTPAKKAPAKKGQEGSSQETVAPTVALTG